MKIRKNDKVTLNQPLTLQWRKEPLAAGTEMIVWKAHRDGTLACSCKETHGGSVYVKPEQVNKITRNCPMPAIGDLFYSSWGYDQTNIDFYQVTSVKNRMVGLTPIAGNSKYDGPMNGNTKPQPNHFIGEEKMHLVKFDGEDRPYFRLNSYSSAWPTTADESHFFSEWA
jgi:hypothetical protein